MAIKDESENVRSEKKRRRPSGVSYGVGDPSHPKKRFLPHPSKTEGFGPRYLEDASRRLDMNLPGEPEEHPFERPLPGEPRFESEAHQTLLVDQTLVPRRRAEMWTMLAALPGASPETQALARLAQASVPQVRTPNPNSLKELEKRSLLS